MRIPAVILLFLTAFTPTSFGQVSVGAVLSGTTTQGGAKFTVRVSETVSDLVVEAKPSGRTNWTVCGAAKNQAGGTQVIFDVTPRFRGQSLRAKVTGIRPAPQLAPVLAPKNKGEIQVAAGLPAGTMLSAEFFDGVSKQWKRFALGKAPTDTKKTLRIAVPAKYRTMQLRVTRLDAKAPSSQSSRFPAAFRTGKSKFAGRVIAAQSNPSGVQWSGAVLADSASSKSATPQVEESDIWKISGTKIYFFNQSRGLQVIETVNPSYPEIVSSLRMPAVGEDMYLLPGSRAVLVRRDWRNGGTTGVVLVDASQPQAKILSELHVPGWYADSRLVNGRLVLATTQWDSASWQSSTTVRVIDNLAAAPRITSEAMLDFSANAMGTGSEFLWVAGSKNWSSTQSSIALFPVDSLPALGTPLRTELGGMIYDKFKVHQNGDSLFAVTQSWGANWRQSTALESYSLGAKPTLLQRLPLVEGESLHATRFDGNRAYVVTFEQIDPLWIIDLADPSAMRIESELQVPGWSTYIQPVGGYLAAVGVDAGKVTASLFDVRDPAKPSLSSRVDIGDGYSWSEANWDEKAVAILPENGLILLPYSSFNSEGNVSAVQLVDMDAKLGKLTKRGIVRHAFTPRRANALREGLIASISNRELFLLDASNRDQPAALSEVTLAFGADRIVGSRNDLLLHAENGDWRGSPAMLRVSSASDPDAVVSEAPLGEGDLLATALRGNHVVALLRGRKDMSEGRLVRFDASQLPKLVETGRTTIKLAASWNSAAELVWPADNLAVAAVRNKAWSWWRGPWIADALPFGEASSRIAVSPGIYPPPYFSGEESVTLHAFDLSAPSPHVASTLDLASIKPRNVSAFFAADGLVVFSSDKSQQEAPAKQGVQPRPNTLEYSLLQVVDFADPSAPTFWPETALPGKLENITEFDRAAGLVYAASGAGALDALLYEGGAAQTIATLPKSDLRALDGRTAWTFSGDTLSRQRLDNTGAWIPEGSRKDLPTTPDSAVAYSDGFLARNGSTLLSVPVDFEAPVRNMSLPGWSWWQTSDLSEIHLGSGFIAAPVGQYGIELLK